MITFKAKQVRSASLHIQYDAQLSTYNSNIFHHH